MILTQAYRSRRIRKGCGLAEMDWSTWLNGLVAPQLSEMFVTGRQRMQSVFVADQQFPTFRHHSNPCYRQNSNLPTNGP